MLSLKRSERNYSVRKNSASSLSGDPVPHPVTNSKPSSSEKNSNNLYRQTKTGNTSNKLTVKKDFGQSSRHDSDTLEKFIKYGQQFVVENKKNLQVDRNNFLQQTASTQTDVDTYLTRNSANKGFVKIKRAESGVEERTCSDSNDRTRRPVNNNRLMIDEGLVNFSEPRPPDKRKPEMKKQINPQRMKRYVLYSGM